MGLVSDLFAEILEREGAVVERLAPDALDVVSPPHVQEYLHVPELVRLGFGSEVPEGALRVVLDPDWVRRLDGLLSRRGRWASVVLDPPNLPPAAPERAVEHNVVLANATVRIEGIATAWTRYLVLLLRFAAVSDEKHEGILYAAFNLATGSAVDGSVETLLHAAAAAPGGTAPRPPDGVRVPDFWPDDRIAEVLARALPQRIEGRLAPFLAGMRRRQQRDLAHLTGYYDDLRRECVSPRRRGRTAGASADEAAVAAKLEAIARDYAAKVGDLRQRYAVTVEAEWIQALELVMPVQRFTLLLRRRKGERRLTLDYNPLVRRLEVPPCEHCFTVERTRLACDVALHLTCPEGLAPCPGCSKPRCRVCHPDRCPRCAHAAAGDSS